MRPAGAGRRRSNDSAVMVLPEPDSPTSPSVSPARIAKLTPSTAFTRPQRVLGARGDLSPRGRSRSYLPEARVEPVAEPVAEEVEGEHDEHDAAPGITESHQALAMWLRPSATIWPHDGVGGGMPAPRKLSEASTMITKPMCSVSRTMNVVMTFGTMWTSMILKLEQPCTPGEQTSPAPSRRGPRRAPRARTAQMITVIAITMVLSPAPRLTARSRDQDRGERERGVDTRMRTESDAPAEVAAMMPTASPMRPPESSANAATVRLTRAQYTRRLNRSRPAGRCEQIRGASALLPRGRLQLVRQRLLGGECVAMAAEPATTTMTAMMEKAVHGRRPRSLRGWPPPTSASTGAVRNGDALPASPSAPHEYRTRG